MILLVDDDAAVREVTSAILRDLRYAVIEAGSGADALELLGQRPAVDLMLVDFAMPGMNGAEVARLARAVRPSLPVLFVTGYADRAALVGVNETHIIGKPFANDELAAKIKLALAR
jgi:CheY-like chemotaxis protein